MFFGEALCLAAFGFLIWRASRSGATIDRAKPFNRLLLAIPAAHDMCATSTMYVGLALTTASSFQMLRGSVVIFTALFSVFFLGRKQYLFHWVGVVLVAIGSVLVGVAGIISSGSSSSVYPNQNMGNLLIVLAQIIVASQMVVEERLIGGYNIPALEVVGFEGVSGITLLSIVLIVFYYVPKPALFCPDLSDSQQLCPGRTITPCNTDHFEDTPDAFVQMGNNPIILVATLGNILSIAGFNFFGISVTKHLNAATRMVLDSVRTIVIWVVSVAVGWDVINLSDGGFWTQLAGFFVLLFGTVVYNAIIKLPFLWYPPEDEGAGEKEDSARAALMDHDGLAVSLNAELGEASPAFGLVSSEQVTHTPSGVMGRATLIKKR
jgi:uncharacterized membrane protein